MSDLPVLISTHEPLAVFFSPPVQPRSRSSMSGMVSTWHQPTSIHHEGKAKERAKRFVLAQDSHLTTSIPPVRSPSLCMSHSFSAHSRKGKSYKCCLALSHLNQHPFAHTASKFQLAKKPVECLCGTSGETELALSPLPHHRPETGWMKLLSSPNFQIRGAIVMVLPPIWDLQLVCPCCICRGHLNDAAVLV